MSRFLEKIIKICPPYVGTNEQLMANYDSHNWRIVDMNKRYSISGLGTFAECQTCGVLADTEYSKYACGSAPDGITYDEYIRSKKSTTH